MINSQVVMDIPTTPQSIPIIQNRNNLKQRLYGLAIFMKSLHIVQNTLVAVEFVCEQEPTLLPLKDLKDRHLQV